VDQPNDPFYHGGLPSFVAASPIAGEGGRFFGTHKSIYLQRRISNKNGQKIRVFRKSRLMQTLLAQSESRGYALHKI
jgi:hypothetical protein